MNREALINLLWKGGYFWRFESGKNVKQADLTTLALTDRVVIEAVFSWQQADQNFNVLSQVVHGRAIIPDGDVGPVTTVMVDVPRCGMPDFAPPEGAVFDFGNADLNRAVESMRERASATGSGSWPVPGCDKTIPNGATTHSITIGLDIAKCPSTIKSYLDKALAEVSKAYAEVGLSVRYIQHTGTVPACNIDKRFESLAGSVIGWNEFPSSGTCNQTIDGRLDTGYAPSNWLLWANLECHETGHGVGLQHGRGSIMNPSIVLVDPMTWVGTYSFANLKKWFGGVPIGPPVPPPPPPPPPVGDYNGVFTVGSKLYKIRVFE